MSNTEFVRWFAPILKCCGIVEISGSSRGKGVYAGGIQ